MSLSEFVYSMFYFAMAGFSARAGWVLWGYLHDFSVEMRNRRAHER